MLHWLPPDLSLPVAASLVALSFVTSALTASMGAGGGLLMLAAMAGLMPAMAVIPVHGLVQLGSNAGRALMARQHIARRPTGLILGGAALGTVAGSLVLFQLPVDWLQVAVAVFILLVVWAPLPRFGSGSGPGLLLFGGVSGFLGLFVGATGPLVAAFTQRIARERHEAVATMAACQSGLHLLKLVAFGIAGFAWEAWLALAAAMVLSGLAGTRLGLRLLGKLSEQRFRWLFRGVLSALALHAAWRGISALS